MDWTKPLALLGTVIVLAMVGAGLGSLASNYALEVVEGARTAPTIASMAVVATVVFGLFVVGAKSDRWLETPYW